MLKRLLLAIALLLAPADAFAQSSKLSNLTAGGAIAGTDLFYDVQSVGVGGVKVTGTQLSTFVLTPPVNVALGTITTNTLGVNITGTFNNAAQVFDAPLFVNIVNTASAAGSAIVDVQLAGTPLFSVLPSTTATSVYVPNGGMSVGIHGLNLFLGTGNIAATQFNVASTGNVNVALLGAGGLALASSGTMAWTASNSAGASTDTLLYRDAAQGVVGLTAFGFAASTLRVYNTTDQDGGASPVNFERGVFDWTTNANVLTIGTQSGGTGTARNTHISAQGTIISFGQSTTAYATLNLAGNFTLANGILLGFAVSGGFTPGTNLAPDTGLARNAAGVVEVDNGTLGGFRDLTLRHVRGNGAPTASACTGFALTTGSSDLAGGITLTSGTTCSITFAAAFANAPSCVITPGSAAATTQVTTTTTTMSATFGAAQTAFSYHCIGL